MNYLYISAIGVGGSTLLGYLLGLLVRNVPHKINDGIIGMCAGIMLCAAVTGLILPSFAVYDDFAHKLIPCFGMACGAFLLTVLDRITPHLHKLTGLDIEEHENNQHLDRILLFVLAIAIHKLPEGISAGVGFGASPVHEMTGHAIRVALGISIQNIPEGMVVATPLLLAGVKPLRTLVLAIIISSLEVAGVFIGYFLGSISELLLPFFLAFSGGAMLYVISDEMIPESHTHGYEKIATFALIGGFTLMLFV